MKTLPRILLTGKNGQVGFELQRALAPLGEVIAFDRAGCDLANPDVLRAVARSVAPQVIVNAAAYTAVDKAESDVDTAMSINAVAPGILGEEARRLGALVVHYSTDYVFAGDKPAAYVESDATAPQNVYGRSKLAGEQALLASAADSLILRTSWVVGAYGGNFAKTMLRLAGERDSLNVVADQFGAPTSAALIADVTAQIVARYLRDSEAFPCGVYHLAAAGETNWHAYACHVVARALAAGVPLRLTPAAVHPIATRDYPTPARRPANSRLDTASLRQTFGLHLPDWRNGVDHILEQILRP